MKELFSKNLYEILLHFNINDISVLSDAKGNIDSITITYRAKETDNNGRDEENLG